MNMSRVKFGLRLPTREPLIYPETISLDQVLDLAVEAELGGFDSVWVGDSILSKHRYEAVTILGAVAAKTSKVKLGTCCMSTFPLRHPVLTAYQWATLDQLSRGRTILAVCMGGASRGTAGDYLHEYENLGVDYTKRAKILEENIKIITALWTGEKITYHGQFHKLTAATLEPKPYQKPRPPIWLVSNPQPFDPANERVQKALQRVARLADGWMTTNITPVQLRQGLNIIADERLRWNLSAKGFEAAFAYNINVNDDEEKGFMESKDFLERFYMKKFSTETINSWVAYGRPDRCIKKLEEYIDAGATVIPLRITSPNQKEVLKRIVDEILPSFN